MDNYNEDKPPSSAFGMDITSRRVFTVGVLRRKVQRYPHRLDAVCFIHGARLGRRSLNLPYIRTEGQG